MCALASGSPGTVTAANLAAGANNIFAALKANEETARSGGTYKSFSEVLSSVTGKTEAEIKSAINTGSADAVDFVRRLVYNTNGGAGSLLTSDLSVGGAAILGDTASPSGKLDVDTTTVKYPTAMIDDGDGAGGAGIGVKANGGGFIHVGSEAGVHIDFDLFHVDHTTLGLSELYDNSASDSSVVLDADLADKAIDKFKKALAVISYVRGYYGSIQNRLDHTIKNLDNISENTTAAESQIRDTDMATEMVSFSNYNILEQAGTSMLAQANQTKQGILSLLQ
ncbi:MAG: flagellin [Lachnospiraceae bacterium]|nr:flagellin [Lachnospiraceae bacterium]